MITQIGKEKAEADAKSKSEAQAQQVVSEASQQADHTTQASDYQTYVEAPQGAYQTSDQANNNSTLAQQQSYQPPAPSTQIPNTPYGGNGNASGITDSPGGWDTPNNAGLGPWMP